MDLRKELELSFPNCLALLRKWRQDLEKNEHGIVIAGKMKNTDILKTNIQVFILQIILNMGHICIPVNVNFISKK